MEFTVLIVQYLENNFSKVCSSYGQFAYFSDIFIFGKSENCIGKICQLIITWTNFSRQTNYSYLGSYYKYWSYHKYVLFEFFWLIFIYTYRTMTFVYFLFGEKLKKWKFSLSFQACNIYKYRHSSISVVLISEIFKNAVYDSIHFFFPLELLSYLDLHGFCFRGVPTSTA